MGGRSLTLLYLNAAAKIVAQVSNIESSRMWMRIRTWGVAVALAKLLECNQTFFNVIALHSVPLGISLSCLEFRLSASVLCSGTSTILYSPRSAPGIDFPGLYRLVIPFCLPLAVGHHNLVSQSHNCYSTEQVKQIATKINQDCRPLE